MTDLKQIQKIDQLPNLHNLKESPRELSSEYWTPEDKGEYKVGVVMGISAETYENQQEETIELPCVIFLSQEKDGSFSTIRNGSKRLVANIENAIDSGEITEGQTPIKITYKGKKKNKTNSFQSDDWAIKPLIIE